MSWPHVVSILEYFYGPLNFIERKSYNQIGKSDSVDPINKIIIFERTILNQNLIGLLSRLLNFIKLKWFIIFIIKKFGLLKYILNKFQERIRRVVTYSDVINLNFARGNNFLWIRFGHFEFSSIMRIYYFAFLICIKGIWSKVFN